MSGFVKQSNNQLLPFNYSLNCFKCARKLWPKICS